MTFCASGRSRVQRARASIWLGGAILVASSCGDSATDPNRFAGTYAMTPTTLTEETPLGQFSYFAGAMILAGSMTLDGANGWELRVRVDPVGIVGPQDDGVDGVFAVASPDTLLFAPNAELICCARDTSGNGEIDVADTVMTFIGLVDGDRLSLRILRTTLELTR